MTDQMTGMGHKSSQHLQKIHLLGHITPAELTLSSNNSRQLIYHDMTDHR